MIFFEIFTSIYSQKHLTENAEVVLFLMLCEVLSKAWEAFHPTWPYQKKKKIKSLLYSAQSSVGRFCEFAVTEFSYCIRIFF